MTFRETGAGDSPIEAKIRSIVREELEAVLDRFDRLRVLPLVLSKKLAAQHLSVSVKTLDRLIANGTIRATPVAGRLGIHRRELERFAEPPPPRPTRMAWGRRRAQQNAHAEAEKIRERLRQENAEAREARKREQRERKARRPVISEAPGAEGGDP